MSSPTGILYSLSRSPYQISNNSDRLGLRLAGTALVHSKGFNIASDGIVTGAIQVPGNGLPIILFNDHQITGGYPKIATIISANLPKLGRILPGEEIFFQAVSIAAAEDIRIKHEDNLHQMIAGLQPYTTREEAMSIKLNAINLVEGLYPFPD